MQAGLLWCHGCGPGQSWQQAAPPGHSLPGKSPCTEMKLIKLTLPTGHQCSQGRCRVRLAPVLPTGGSSRAGPQCCAHRAGGPGDSVRALLQGLRTRATEGRVTCTHCAVWPWLRDGKPLLKLCSPARAPAHCAPGPGAAPQLAAAPDELPPPVPAVSVEKGSELPADTDTPSAKWLL